MSINYAALKSSVIDALTTELSGDPNFNANILAVKTESVIREVILRRNYGATAYTDAQIASDLDNFYSTIVNVTRYDYNQIGAEGEQAHNENSTSRTWVDRNKLFNGVVAFVKVF